MSLKVSFLSACSALPAPVEGKAPDWLMLIPAGTSQGVDGRGPYLNDQPDVVVAASLEGSRPIPFDYNHQSIFAALNGQASPASGWIDKLENRDGAIWGHVEWTDAGGMAVASREYRYVSPAFKHDKSGRVQTLHSAGLVNSPNLTELPAINAQISALFSKTGDENSMDETMRARLAAVYGLAANATVEMIVAHAEKLKLASGAPDPALYVPMAAFAELQGQVASLTKSATDGHAAKLVEDASKAGKLVPALRDWALAYASQDATGFEKWIASAPVIVPGGNDPALAVIADVSTHASGLTSAELTICAQLGITHEAYKANKKGG